MAALMDEINTWFVLRIQKLEMKESVEWSVNIMVLRRVTATCPLKVEMWNYLSKWIYISIEKNSAVFV